MLGVVLHTSLFQRSFFGIDFLLSFEKRDQPILDSLRIFHLPLCKTK